MKRVFLTILFLLLASTQALSESSVWKLQKGGSVIFLGGTCHLLRQSDFPLPPEFDKAYRAAQILVFETDLGKLRDPSTQQMLISKATYADGSTIEKHLSPRTYNLLKEYCVSNGIPLEALKQFKPSIIAVTMTAMELAKLGVTQEGVDTFFYQLAKKDNKTVEGLETVEAQIEFLVGMGEGNEDAFVKYSIKDLKSIKKEYERMVEAWKRGDTKKLNNLMIDELKTKTPNLYNQLLVERNRNWLPMFDACQKTDEKEFILVGVAHLVGPDGILKDLKRKGYKVEKL